jgi:hypothetical protein
MRYFRPALIAVLLAVPLVAPAGAQARALRAPKWLSGPYRQYVLTYDGTDASQGNEVTSTPNPSTGNACDYPVTTYSDSQTARYHAAYQVLFGRFRQGRRYQLAFIYVLRTVSGPGQDTKTQRSDPPAGCPPFPAFAAFPAGSCTTRSHANGPPELTGAPRHRGTAVALAVIPSLETVGDPTCSGNPRFDDFNHDPSVNPGTALLSVSQSAVTHRRVIHGKVSADPADAHSGNGTDPPSDANAGTQKVWSFSTRLNATVTLAPGTRAR